MDHKKMQWRENEISKIVSVLRKKTCGKEPETVETELVRNMAVVSMTGVLTPIEKFISQTDQGKKTVRYARTELIKQRYKNEHPFYLEKVADAKYIELFTDINIHKDWALSVFVFDRNIDASDTIISERPSPDEQRKKESELANLIRTFRKQYVGKGPERIKVTLYHNIVLIYTEGNLTPVEKFISTNENGKKAIVEARSEMIKELYLRNFPTEIKDILAAQCVDVFVDINIENDTAMTVFILDDSINSEQQNEIIDTIESFRVGTR